MSHFDDDHSTPPTTHSPTTCTYCYELKCAVTVQSSACNASASTAAKRINCREATLLLGRNSRRQILLEIASASFRASYLLDDCRVHMRAVRAGKGAIEIRTRQMIVSMSNCAPHKLNVFLRSLDAKLLLMTEMKRVGTHATATPAAASARRALLEGLPNVFEKLSPLSIAEMKHIHKLRERGAGSTGDLHRDGKENRPPSATTTTPGRTPRNTRKKPTAVGGLTARLSETPRQRMQPPSPDSTRPPLLSPIQLSSTQKRVVRAVLRGENVFFTGSAGTGKSIVLQRLVGMLPAETTVVTAATGVAACQIGGITLHSFAGIGHGSGTMEECVRLLESGKKNCVLQWRRCTHLIVDEISMIDADFFDRCEAVARAIRGDRRVFGGIQLIVTGDFLQLPPVSSGESRRRFCFQARDKRVDVVARDCLQSNAWQRAISRVIVLDEVRRQDDPRFVRILQDIRFGRCDAEAAALLSATAENRLETLGILPTRLCTHAIDAEALNAKNLEQLPG